MVKIYKKTIKEIQLLTLIFGDFFPRRSERTFQPLMNLGKLNTHSFRYFLWDIG